MLKSEFVSAATLLRVIAGQDSTAGTTGGGAGPSLACRQEAAALLGQIAEEDPSVVPQSLSGLISLLKSKNWDCRIAAGRAVFEITSKCPEARVLGLSGFEEVTSGLLSLSHFDLRTVVERGETLLAAGPQVWVDFGRNLSPKDRAALQRAAILSQLGLEAASDDARAAQRFDGLSEAVTEDDLFAADAAEVARQAALKAQLEQYRAKPLSELVAEVNASGALSARMKNKARRQLASGRAAPVPSAPPLVTTATEPALLPFERLYDELLYCLFDPCWEVRHGAAVGLRESLRAQSKSITQAFTASTSSASSPYGSLFLQDCALRCVCVLALDRFSDYSGDVIVAPVRHTVAQVLALVCSHLPPGGVSLLLHSLLSLLPHPQWHVRHGGLLGAQFVLGVCAALPGAGPTLEAFRSSCLRLLTDDSDDVRHAAFEVLRLLVTPSAVTPFCTRSHVSSALIASARALASTEDLSCVPSAGLPCVQALLARLTPADGDAVVEGEEEVSVREAVSLLIPSFDRFLHDPSSNVRTSCVSVLTAMLTGNAPLCVPLLFSSSSSRLSLAHSLYTAAVCEEVEAARSSVCHALHRLLSPALPSPSSPTPYSSPAARAMDLAVIWFRWLCVPRGEVPLSQASVEAPLPEYLPPSGTRRLLNSPSLGFVSLPLCAPALARLVTACCGPADVNCSSPFVNVMTEALMSSSVSTVCAAAVLLASAGDELGLLSVSDGIVSPLSSACFTSLSNHSTRLSWEDGVPSLLASSCCFQEVSPLLPGLLQACMDLGDALTSAGLSFLWEPHRFLLSPLLTVSDLAPHAADLLACCQDFACEPALSSVESLAACTAASGGSPRPVHHAGPAVAPTDRRRRRAGEVPTDSRRPAPDNPLLRHVRSQHDRLLLATQAYMDRQTSAQVTVLACLAAAALTIANGNEEILLSATRIILQGGHHIGDVDVQAYVADRATACFSASKHSVRSTMECLLASQILIGLSTSGPSFSAILLQSCARRFRSAVLENMPSLSSVISSSLSSSSSAPSFSGLHAVEVLLSGDAPPPVLTSPEAASVLFASMVTPAPPVSTQAWVCLTRLACLPACTSLVIGTLVRGVTDWHGPLRATPPCPVLPILSALSSILGEAGEVGAAPYSSLLLAALLPLVSCPDVEIREGAGACVGSLLRSLPLERMREQRCPTVLDDGLDGLRAQGREALEGLLRGPGVSIPSFAPSLASLSFPFPLRKYQVEGISWLLFLRSHGLHGVLADDMGLGKTVQVLAAVAIDALDRSSPSSSVPSTSLPASLTRARPHLPSLVVCPSSLLYHWEKECARLCSLNPSVPLKPILYSSARALSPSPTDIVIASYGAVRQSSSVFSAVDWAFVVLDEGHAIQNPSTKLFAAVTSLRSEHRVILTGTPIQNHVTDMWALFHFLMPGYLGPHASFTTKFSSPIEKSRRPGASAADTGAANSVLLTLHRLLLPFVLRRTKQAVLADLPPKTVQDVLCDLSPLQAEMYAEFVKSAAFQSLGRSGSGGGTGPHAPPDESEEPALKKAATVPAPPPALACLHALRQICNHPLLLNTGGSRAAMAVEDSCKLLALRDLFTSFDIGSASAGGSRSRHKVLVFTQYSRMLDVIQSQLLEPHFSAAKFARIDGGVSPSDRGRIAERFNVEDTLDVLLLTTSVGGLGLNLTAADVVILVDHDWNPMKDLQAMDRAHRLGQTRPVHVYRLIARNTLEEQIMSLQHFKKAVAAAVVTTENSAPSTMSCGEVLQQLVSTAPAPVPAKAAAEEEAIPGGPFAAVLSTLEDLWPTEQYSELELDAFVQSIRST